MDFNHREQFLGLQKFQDDLENQEEKLRECLHLGQEILKRAHPDAITTVKHWLTILQARWEEVGVENVFLMGIDSFVSFGVKTCFEMCSHTRPPW